MDAETKQAIEVCLRGVLAEQLPRVIRDALDEALELRGVAATTPEQRTDLRKDIEFLRGQRLAMTAANEAHEEKQERLKDEAFLRDLRMVKERAAEKIGNGVLNIVIVALMALIGFGAAITVKPDLFRP